MKKTIYSIILFSLSTQIFAAKELKKHLRKSDTSDLSTIVKKKYIKVLTTKNPYDYYLYQGRNRGIQYEMAKAFVKRLNKKYVKRKDLKIVFEMIPVDFDQLIPMLNQGYGDIIAVGMTQTPERLKQVSFSKPYQLVDDVIVTRKDLAQKDWKKQTFHVQENSSYFHELKKNKILTQTLSANFHPDSLMELISLNKFNYTLVNSFWAKTISKRFDNLTIITPDQFRKKVSLSWAVRKNNPDLLKEVNNFIPKVKKGSFLGNVLNNTYFNDIGRIQTVHFDLKTNKLSPYDEQIKKYAQQYGFDWRMLAALCFQESKFNQEIVNKWGAIGLFQVKQMTANEPYINIRQIRGPANYENNIHAGVKYLAWIKKRYFDPNKQMSEEVKLRMTMAAYNAGPRRVQQAIAKAKKMNLNPNKWFRNVEIAMLRRGYPEPVIYVSEINKRFVSYDLLGIK